ncbi:DUF3592 domain-containing protein [Hyphomonas johnsonii]|uniref:DUF3592 domain-containing protein n=1 Tax=Hyphomonas johnsonii MHS-2 TaxID=1280950 RepID=A0A059F9Y3_9PROT|nr:DUF3592 domain-containing protein [Hyphomonas johnsonii]KCZ87353.1 hypothetical protein HJO_16942 [Hyphomonas johnsonii MHS-2]
MLKRLKQAGLGLVVLLTAMILVGSLVAALFPADWHAVQATVQSTRIESVRNGVPEWAVRVEATYEMSGRTYDTQKDVFTNTDRDLSVAELENWPQGRDLTLYANVKSPGTTSLSPDGGREAAVVVAVMLTPALTFFIWLVAFVIFRRRRNAREAAG